MLSESFKSDIGVGDRVLLTDSGVGGYVDDVRFMPEKGVKGYRVFDDKGGEAIYYGDGNLEKQNFDIHWCQLRSYLDL